jgi:hypothetical protein
VTVPATTNNYSQHSIHYTNTIIIHCNRNKSIHFYGWLKNYFLDLIPAYSKVGVATKKKTGNLIQKSTKRREKLIRW